MTSRMSRSGRTTTTERGADMGWWVIGMTCSMMMLLDALGETDVPQPWEGVMWVVVVLFILTGFGAG